MHTTSFIAWHRISVHVTCKMRPICAFKWFHLMWKPNFTLSAPCKVFTRSSAVWHPGFF